MLMKHKPQKYFFALIVAFLLACGLVLFSEARFQTIQRGYDEFVLDDHNHYLTCEDLPSSTAVETTVQEHADVIQEIQEIAPGVVGIEVDSSACVGKADLLIWYGTHQQRVAIERIIGGDTFFGIPYRLQNR